MSGVGWDIIGTLIVAVGTAATLYAAFHALRKAGRPVPKWVMPAAIGVAMIAYATWNEYSWFNRVTAQLPDRVVVLAEGETRVAFRPWSYLAPMTLRFTALDRAAIREAGGGVRVAPVMLVERWRDTVTVEHGVDCARGAVQAPGEPWVGLPADDPLLRTVCQEG
ncbi:MAG: hypothetical protein Q4G36_03570 [Paracoccus sp. (in: a-proteobacteria)]|nr:hypothetical protein [Paracoccus sp. (in: a-proteobacteria)]